MARGHHVGLEQGPLQVHVMVTQGLEHRSQDLGIRGGLLKFWAPATHYLMFPVYSWVGMTVRVGTGQTHRYILGSSKRVLEEGACI